MNLPGRCVQITVKMFKDSYCQAIQNSFPLHSCIGKKDDLVSHVSLLAQSITMLLPV